MLLCVVELEVKICLWGNMCFLLYGNGNVNFFNFNCKFFFLVVNFF